MQIVPDKNPNTDAVIINRYVFCHHHFPQSKTNDKSVIPPKRVLVDKLKKARKLMNSAQQTTPKISVPVIPAKKVAEIKKTLNLQSIDDICYYWALKRKSRCGVPLIRRLQVYHNAKTASPLTNKQAQARRAALPQEYSLMSSLRTNLEKVRLLCELVKKREKLKHEMISTSESLIDNCMKPISVIMRETLDKLLSKDHLNVSAKFLQIFWQKFLFRLNFTKKSCLTNLRCTSPTKRFNIFRYLHIPLAKKMCLAIVR